jgi:hypothetical protein
VLQPDEDHDREDDGRGQYVDDSVEAPGDCGDADEHRRQGIAGAGARGLVDRMADEGGRLDAPQSAPTTIERPSTATIRRVGYSSPVVTTLSVRLMSPTTVARAKGIATSFRPREPSCIARPGGEVNGQ